MVHFTIYDDKKIDIKSNNLKNIIADAVKDLILRDWDKLSKVNQYQKMNGDKKEYYTEIELWGE